MSFKLFNGQTGHPELPSDPTSTSFTLRALPDSDVWRTPQVAKFRDDFNGTIYATSMPLSSFQKASVTVSADWKVRYAQGGLVIFVPGASKQVADNGVTKWESSPEVWIKTGIEFEEGMTFASVVAANPLSDWSLMPWRENSVSIELERNHGALWVYATGKDGKRVPMREMTWAFDQEEQKGECWVGVLAAMPLPDGTEDGGKLEVKFENLVIEKVAK